MCLLWNIVPVVFDALTFARNLLRSQSAVAAENFFLRKQLSFYVEREKKPQRTANATRFTMATLARLFERKDVLVVKPDTLIRSPERVSFVLTMAVSTERTAIPFEDLQKLIAEMATANIAWGEERSANELFICSSSVET